MSNTALANYEQEQALFTELIASDAEPNILLFQGESGSGKSYLIEQGLKQMPNTPAFHMKLDRGGDLLPILWARMGVKLGWERLPHFTRRVAELLEQSSEAMNPEWQVKMFEHIKEIGKIPDIESRLSRYYLLTDAWFADAMGFERPFLLALDSYEYATTLFDQWFRERFLARVAFSRQMRVVVGGQKVPVAHESWEFSAVFLNLNGVHEADAWLKWATEVGYQISSPEDVTTLVSLFGGNPSQIIEAIKLQFPRSNGRVQNFSPQRRKRLYENIRQSFNLADLKNICFFLGIDYEDLSGRDTVSGFIRELIAYAQKTNLLQDLIQMCCDERPHLEW